MPGLVGWGRASAPVTDLAVRGRGVRVGLVGRGRAAAVLEGRENAARRQDAEHARQALGRHETADPVDRDGVVAELERQLVVTEVYHAVAVAASRLVTGARI